MSDWILLVVCVSVILYISGFGEYLDMAISDLQKLIENMRRADAITKRAAKDAEKHSGIMDNFEKRLELNRETMSKIEEYDKLMAEMDRANNGGPPLESTFPSTTTMPSSHLFDDKTGRQL